MASFTLHIQYVDRPAETRTFTNRDILTFGRDVADIPLRDSQVSGRHGQITFLAGVLRYEDLGSTNGSFLLDGRRIQTLDLSPGMAIRLGNSVVTVQAVDSPMGAGKGRTMIAGAGMAPFMPMPPRPGDPALAPTGHLPAATPPAGMPPPTRGRTALGNTDDPALAPTGYMPAATPPPGFQQPVAQPPAPPPPVPPALQQQAQADDDVDIDDEATSPNVPAIGGAPAGGGAPPASGAPLTISSSDLQALFKQAWGILQPVLIPAALVVGALTVPVALASGILGLIPVVGPILAGLLGLAQALLMPLAIAAVYRFMLGVYLGLPIDWQDAWRQQIADVKEVWLSFFVSGLLAGVGALFLIIPGILLGAFIGPVHFVEGKRMVDVNLRTLDLTKRDPVPLIVIFIVTGLVAGLAIGIPLAILGLIPLIGGLLSGLLGAAAMAVLIPFGATLSLILYFGFRRRFEGGEPEEAARAILAAVESAKPIGPAA